MSLRKEAEAYILHVVGEMDAKTAEKLMSEFRKQGSPYETFQDFINEYEAESSIPEELVEWIRDEWEEKPATQTVKQFAKAKSIMFLEVIE